MSNDDKRPEWLPQVDLRGITRDSEHVTTYIEVKVKHRYYEWLKFGSLSRIFGEKEFREIGAYLKGGATDAEHDSAWALRIEVSRVELESLYSGCIMLKAWVAGSVEDTEAVRVPPKSILSFDEIKGEPCEADCEEKHLIVERYVPQPDVPLWKHLRGRELKITIVPKSEDAIEDQDEIKKTDSGLRPMSKPVTRVDVYRHQAEQQRGTALRSAEELLEEVQRLVDHLRGGGAPVTALNNTVGRVLTDHAALVALVDAVAVAEKT